MMLSVIVPVYKAEKYLKRCVDSILNQTYLDLEIILVDDGSPDQCPGICDQYAARDSRIKVIHKDNAGVSSARNAGLDAASGEYFTFVDSDDYIEENMFQSMLVKAKEYDCDIVMCDCKKEFGDRSEIYSHNIRAGYYSKDQLKTEYYPHLIIMENVEYPPTISNWLCIFRRKDTPIRYLDGVRFSEDWLFGIQMMSLAESFYYMKGECFYHYCMNEASATHTFTPDKWRDYLILYKETAAYFCDEYFASQVDLMLLFFVYNAVGDLIGTDQMKVNEKLKCIEDILTAEVVKNTLKKIKVYKLPIPLKQKLQTYMYKYNLGIKYLCKRKERSQ